MLLLWCFCLGSDPAQLHEELGKRRTAGALLAGVGGAVGDKLEARLPVHGAQRDVTGCAETAAAAAPCVARASACPPSSCSPATCRNPAHAPRGVAARRTRMLLSTVLCTVRWQPHVAACTQPRLLSRDACRHANAVSGNRGGYRIHCLVHSTIPARRLPPRAAPSLSAPAALAAGAGAVAVVVIVIAVRSRSSPAASSAADCTAAATRCSPLHI